MAKSKYSFSNAPVLRRSRASFDLSHSLFTNLNVGDLKPVLLQEVYPGDQFNITQKGVIRSTYPFIRPIMDNLFFDVAYFFVPYRLICKEWEQCITGGNAEPSDWSSPVEVDIPTYTSGFSTVDGVLDNLGVPCKVGSNNVTIKGVSVMPARAFARVWNDWFRDENTQSPCNIITSGLGANEIPNDSPWSPTNYVGKLPKVNKLHDYFTSALRAPQKGDSVEVGNALSLVGDAPVYISGVANNGRNTLSYTLGSGTTSSGVTALNPNYYQTYCNKSSSANTPVGLMYGQDPSSLGVTGGVYGVNLRTIFGDVGDSEYSLFANSMPSDVRISGLDVNSLRYAFALQRILERSARSGSRYTEYIHSAFGVNASDARLQRSEYLGGSSTPLGIQQVASTYGEFDDKGATSLGNLSAFSLTNNSSHVSKAFTEHGYIIGVSWIRQFHTYSQGIERFLRRKSRYDFYDPSLMHIGEQPVYVSELFASNTDYSDVVFGYQEAWADLRYRPNRVSGLVRKSSVESNSTGLEFYTLSDYYTSRPYLNADFLNEVSGYVWSCMGVEDPNDYMSQFVVDYRFNVKAIRELPTYSIPSMIDHD